MELDKKKNFVISDNVILTFYNENPNLDFIVMNHIFIDILKKLSTNLDETVNTSINSKLLSTLSDMNKEIVSLKQDMSNKMNESKKEYIEDVKLILSNNSLTAVEKINNMLEKNNDAVITKTNLLISDIVPKSQDKVYTQIQHSIHNLQTSLTKETQHFLENMNKDENSVKEFISSIDTQFNKMTTNLQQPIFSFIQSSEERTTTSIQQMKEKILSQQTANETLSTELGHFLNKYKHNSSTKGSVSETELFFIIQQMFPSDEVLDCTGDPSSCDYRVNRLNKTKPNILFENKDYTHSVKTEEVTKFERDVQIQKTHGIFISQKSNITFKENFQIDIIDGFIHIYLPNAQYNQEKFRVAVDIIDNLSQKLDYIKNADCDVTINVNKDDLAELLEGYTEFNKQKSQLIESIKISNKQTLDRIEEMQLNSVKKILNKNGIFQNEDDFKCKFCNVFTGKNKASLGAHIRTCKLNPACSSKNIVISTEK